MTGCLRNVLVLKDLNRSYKLVEIMPKNSQKSDNMKRPRKELKRINWEIATSILKTLYFHGKQKKSILARLTDMGYENCILYLDWLDLLDLVRNNDHSQTAGLTEIGIIFCRTKLIRSSPEFLNQQI